MPRVQFRNIHGLAPTARFGFGLEIHQYYRFYFGIISQDQIVTLLTSSVVSTGLAGVLVYLARNWISERLKNSIKHEYDLQIEKHKAQLKCEADTTIERLRSDLHIFAAERNFRFSKIFEQQLQVVAETFGRLFEFYDAARDYFDTLDYEGRPSMKDRREVLITKFNNFQDYFRPHRVFLPRETAERLSNFYAKVRGLAFNFMWGVEAEGDLKDKNPHKDTQSEVEEIMAKEMMPLIDKLEEDFRKLLSEMKPIMHELPH